MEQQRVVDPACKAHSKEIVRKHGRKMSGWNEILNDRLSRDSAIVSWTGVDLGYHAAVGGSKDVRQPGLTANRSHTVILATISDLPSPRVVMAVHLERCPAVSFKAMNKLLGD